MKCGDLGFTNALGQPCQQNIASDAKGCLWHSRTAAERSLLAARGPFVARMKRALPADYQAPQFATREDVLVFVRDLLQWALTGDIEKWRIAEARQAANLALSVFEAQDQRKLIDAILTMEHGGAAMLLLTRMQESLGTAQRKPLPGRSLAVVPRASVPEGDGA